MINKTKIKISHYFDLPLFTVISTVGALVQRRRIKEQKDSLDSVQFSYRVLLYGSIQFSLSFTFDPLWPMTFDLWEWFSFDARWPLRCGRKEKSLKLNQIPEVFFECKNDKTMPAYEHRQSNMYILPFHSSLKEWHLGLVCNWLLWSFTYSNKFESLWCSLHYAIIHGSPGWSL